MSSNDNGKTKGKSKRKVEHGKQVWESDNKVGTRKADSNINFKEDTESEQYLRKNWSELSEDERISRSARRQALNEAEEDPTAQAVALYEVLAQDLLSEGFTELTMETPWQLREQYGSREELEIATPECKKILAVAEAMCLTQIVIDETAKGNHRKATAYALHINRFTQLALYSNNERAIIAGEKKLTPPPFKEIERMKINTACREKFKGLSNNTKVADVLNYIVENHGLKDIRAARHYFSDLASQLAGEDVSSKVKLDPLAVFLPPTKF